LKKRALFSMGCPEEERTILWQKGKKEAFEGEGGVRVSATKTRKKKKKKKWAFTLCGVELK